jgi:hypothetical protein
VEEKDDGENEEVDENVDDDDEVDEGQGVEEGQGEDEEEEEAIWKLYRNNYSHKIRTTPLFAPRWPCYSTHCV